MATKHIATWANELNYSDLPQDVIQSASRSFYNWVGCAIGGSDHPATTIAYNSLSPFFGPPQSSLLGRKGAKIDAQHAALINGIASHVHDYDDTHLDTIIHPTGPVASALLAVAEWKGGFSGKEFLLALIVGIEVECKLGLAVWPEHYDVGWHITSTTGSIGAAAAVSKLLGLSVEQMNHALGVAATQVIGLREVFGSHTKSFHPGRAAQSGLIAAVLAQGGYTSSETAIEAKRGWANVVGATKSSIPESLEKWLGMDNQDLGLASTNGGRWEILRNSFKPYPCGIVIHPVIDGCSQLHRDIAKLRLEVADIKEVKAKVHPLVLELTGKRKPKDGLEGKFSVFHGGAIGLIFGKGTPRQYEDEAVRDLAVIEVRNKIECVADTTIAADETKIVLTMVDGNVLEKHVKYAVGSIEAPMDDQMLRQKFEDQCAAVLGGGARSASTKCWNVEDMSDIAEIARLA
ncbi:MmgE/PrpD family protein [Hyaloscypha bicolor E]|uniref:MmgE/PrpD family protein n=1 Tax=Hyaloscypha bicolor E TaxID=1095630 RepID=A0A2J6TNZ3_9HELO|nr:MmgE/PrpD family protein [Hyaloscypha bicolor E]PMD64741.1 MmgE/PrpD family protein [Hyaloscypha bicolor E]